MIGVKICMFISHITNTMKNRLMHTIVALAFVLIRASTERRNRLGAAAGDLALQGVACSPTCLTCDVFVDCLVSGTNPSMSCRVAREAAVLHRLDQKGERVRMCTHRLPSCE